MQILKRILLLILIHFLKISYKVNFYFLGHAAPDLHILLTACTKEADVNKLNPLRVKAVLKKRK